MFATSMQNRFPAHLVRVVHSMQAPVPVLQVALVLAVSVHICPDHIEPVPQELHSGNVHRVLTVLIAFAVQRRLLCIVSRLLLTVRPVSCRSCTRPASDCSRSCRWLLSSARPPSSCMGVRGEILGDGGAWGDRVRWGCVGRSLEMAGAKVL